eukprot:15973_1
MHMLVTDNQRLKNYTQEHKEENNNNNNNNDIDYYLDDITIQTDKSWIENDGVLLPPIDDINININKRHSGLNSAPLTLFEIQTTSINEDISDYEQEPELNRNRTIKKEKRKINKFIDTTYNIIKIKQKPWKLPDINHNDNNNNNNNNNNDDEDVDVDVATPLLEDDISHKFATLVGDGISIEYCIPNKYLYINGLYSPKIFDSKFGSMVYANNNNINVEMRVLEHDLSESDGITILSTWIIVDIIAKCVLYQNDGGNSLYKPPINGWKRLIDNNEYHSLQKNGDLNIEIIENEIKYGSIPSPQIIELTHSSCEAIMIEYDYKQLDIKHVPHLQQWIEIIAHNITSPNNDEILKIIYIIKQEEEEEKKQDESQRAYNIFTENAEILERKRDKKLKKLDWIRRKFEFDGLLLEEEYKFSIKLSNCITYTESVLSRKIMPMTLPSPGIINSVKCDPYIKMNYILIIHIINLIMKINQ